MVVEENRWRSNMCIYSVTKEENQRTRGKKITEGNVPEIKEANHRLKGIFP